MSKIPRILRDQLQIYAKAGFTVRDISKTSKHWKVSFHEIAQFQILTANESDPRALKNNLARFKRIANIKGDKK